MKIISSEIIKKGDCNIYVLHVKISDIKGHAEKMISIISDTSWISKHNKISQVTFKANVEKTIDKLVNKVIKKVKDKVTKEFGEYLISFTSQEALEQQLNHIKVPLAELIKEQISGNPGFDFHTETHNGYILFGEAKYQFHSNPHKDAIDQIKLFITKKKDDSELELISKFVSQRASNNYLDNKKTYAASFSVKGKKISQILKTALKHIDVAPLNSYPELYIIGIEIQ